MKRMILFIAIIGVSLLAPLTPAHTNQDDRPAIAFMPEAIVETALGLEELSSGLLDRANTLDEGDERDMLTQQAMLLRDTVDGLFEYLESRLICSYQVYTTDPCETQHEHSCEHFDHSPSTRLVPSDIDIEARRALHDCPMLPTLLEECDLVTLSTPYCGPLYRTNCWVIDFCDEPVQVGRRCYPGENYCVTLTCGEPCWPGVPYRAPSP